MPLDVGQEAVEGGALVIRAVRIGHQVEAHLPAFHHDLFHTQMAGHAAKADDADKLLSLGRYLAETVFQPGFEGLDVALLLHLVEFAIERDAFGVAGDIGRRETQLEVALDIGLADKLGAVALLVGKVGIEVGELFALYMLTDALGGNLNLDMNKLADRVQEILDMNAQIKDVAEKLHKLNNFIILSRGTMLGTGDECALKLTECCYLFNRSYSSANFMHGPLSLLDDKANVILLAPDCECKQEFADMAKRAKNLGANLTVFSNVPEILDLATNKVVMPDANALEAPVLYGTAISLLALNIGLAKGLNVDTPRNLNKVTITL